MDGGTQSLMDAREKSERDLKGLLMDKDAENVRLRAEINRLRSALEKTDQLHSSQAAEVQSLQEQLNQTLILSRATERQAVLAAAASRGTGSPGNRELHQIQAELDAERLLVSRLEADLQSQAAAASKRLAEMQSSFEAKIAELRKSNQEAVAAAVAAATARQGAGGKEEALQAELASTREELRSQADEVLQLRAQVGLQNTDAEALHDQVNGLTEQVRRSEREAARLAEQERSWAEEKRQLEQALQDAATTCGAVSAPASLGSGSGMDADMLAMMEGQLQRLSALIRSKEAELSQLRQAVQDGCLERKELVARIEQIQRAQEIQLQQPVSPKADSVKSGASHGPVSPNSVKHNVGGLHKPYRTGLHSKPKFR